MHACARARVHTCVRDNLRTLLRHSETFVVVLGISVLLTFWGTILWYFGAMWLLKYLFAIWLTVHAHLH